MKRLIIAALALAIVLAAAYSAAWFYVASMAHGALEKVVADQRRSGVFASYENFERSGFPTSLRIDADNPQAEGPDGLRWNGEAIAVEARNWWRRNIGVHLIGRHSLTGPDRFPIVATSQGGAASFHVSWMGDVPSGSVVLDRLDIETDSLPPPYNLTNMQIDQFATLAELIDYNNDGADDLDLQVDATGIVLGTPIIEELGTSIDRAGLVGTVSGPLPRRRMREQDAVVWRDNGGQVRIERLNLQWGPLTIEADGDLTLDAALQPRGQITIRVEGYAVLLDMLEDRGLLDGRQGTMARIGIQMMAGPPDADGRSVLEAPLTIQDRRVQVGPVRVATLPEIVWPR